jgi:hypothetical protein
MAASVAELEDVVNHMESLKVREDGEGEEGLETKDDGYNSSSSTENLTEKLGLVSFNEKEEEKDEGVEEKDEEKDEEEKGEEEEDDERILEPLVILKEESVGPEVEFISRGPVSVEHLENRFQPYSRPDQLHSGVIQSAGKHDEDKHQPLPNVLIYTKRDRERPTKIDVKIEWSDKHELCIDKYRLPEDTWFMEGTNNIQLFIQLNPSVKDTKSFLADVKDIADESGQRAFFIGPIVISLKTDLADSQERILLQELTEEERMGAMNLVAEKDIAQLVSGIGPQKDTVLAILSAQRKSPNPGQVMAQIHAVVQRLLRHKEDKVRLAVFKLNNNGISAFEIAAIMNNSFVACYLAEVMYNLIDDTRTALKILNGKDSQGNTIIHLLSRKGDSNAMTLRKLLGMRLTDNTRVFTLGFNSKKQQPMHIVAQSKKNQPETIAILNQAFIRSFEIQDDDGMTPLHYACQRTGDTGMVETILSYKKDNISTPRKDGLTALDLVSMRPTNTGEGQSIFDIDYGVQIEIMKLLKNNGGKSSFPEPESPSHPHYNIPMGNMSSPNTPSTSSPLGSPYDSSVNASPRTLPDDCPGGYYGTLRAPGSVESYIQSSPESEHGELQSTRTRNYSFHPRMMDSPASVSQDSSYLYMDSPVGNGTSLEEHLASQIFNEFPEIRNVVGQIMDGSL